MISSYPTLELGLCDQTPKSELDGLDRVLCSLPTNALGHVQCKTIGYPVPRIQNEIKQKYNGRIFPNAFHGEYFFGLTWSIKASNSAGS